MLSRGTARPVLAGAILAFCPRLVFPPRPRAPSLAAARSLPPAFTTGALPPNRIGEGSPRRRRRAAGSPAPRRSEVRIVSLLFNFWFSRRRHLSLPRGIVSRDRSCFCFDRLSGRLESAKARGMLCRFPGRMLCPVRCGSRAREENRRFFLHPSISQFRPPGAHRLLLLAFGIFQPPNSFPSVLYRVSDFCHRTWSKMLKCHWLPALKNSAS